jgi:ABC-type glutathione transport system ATPase component
MEKSDVAEFVPPTADPEAIGFHNAVFTWGLSDAGSTPATPSRRKFMLRIEDDLFFKRGAFNLIIGPTGSGKTSLLLALLGELHFSPPGPDSWFNLPRETGVAYAAQEPWVLNETIKVCSVVCENFKSFVFHRGLFIEKHSLC